MKVNIDTITKTIETATTLVEMEPVSLDCIQPKQSYRHKQSKVEPRNFSARRLAENYHKHALTDPRSCIIITECTSCMEALALHDYGVPFNRIVAFNFKQEPAQIIRDNPETQGMHVICSDIRDAVMHTYSLGLRPVSISIDPTHIVTGKMFEIVNHNWKALNANDRHDVLWSINVMNSRSNGFMVQHDALKVGNASCNAIATILNGWLPMWDGHYKVQIEGVARYTDEAADNNVTFEMAIVRTWLRSAGDLEACDVEQVGNGRISVVKKGKPAKKTKSRPNMTKARRERLEFATIEREDILLEGMKAGTLTPMVAKAIKRIDKTGTYEDKLDFIAQVAVQWAVTQEATFIGKGSAWVSERMRTLGHNENKSTNEQRAAIAVTTRMIRELEDDSNGPAIWAAFKMIEK